MLVRRSPLRCSSRRGVRFYINNFMDGDRQDGVDLLTGAFVPSAAAPTPFAPRKSQESLASVATKASAA